MSFVVKQSLILSFLESKSRKLLCTDDILFCTNHSVYSVFSLYILVLCGELLCPVMSHCCGFFFFLYVVLSSFVCTRSVVLLRMCKHRLCGHVPPATLYSYSDTSVIIVCRTRPHSCQRCYCRSNCRSNCRST